MRKLPSIKRFGLELAQCHSLHVVDKAKHKAIPGPRVLALDNQDMYRRTEVAHGHAEGLLCLFFISAHFSSYLLRDYFLCFHGNKEEKVVWSMVLLV